LLTDNQGRLAVLPTARPRGPAWNDTQDQRGAAAETAWFLAAPGTRSRLLFQQAVGLEQKLGGRDDRLADRLLVRDSGSVG
jgi:hypothetical protein